MTFDIAIIGAGIAGAGLAYELGANTRVVVLEAEDLPGYHSTGRSAAFWSETYGGPWVQPLTAQSRDFLESPPEDFVSYSLLKKRGALHIADYDGLEQLRKFRASFDGKGVDLVDLDSSGIVEHVPRISRQWKAAILEPSCCDIDAAGLHSGYLRGAKRNGAELRCNFRVTRVTRSGSRWSIYSSDEMVEADLLVNAAGAWADEIAAIAGVDPIGIKPYSRTMVQLVADPEPKADLPLVIDALGRFYFKAEAGGRLWVSPHDEKPAQPGDVAPDEMDVAIAADRLEKATDWSIRKIERKWAGLRTFSPDRLPVYGFDPTDPQFFWCAGQGGFGIQSAPAASRLCAALIANHSVESAIDAQRYFPDRFR